MDGKKCPKAIIFVAMEDERSDIVTPALKKLGLAGRDDIWVVVTGVGKVKAAITASRVLLTTRVLYGDEAKKCICFNVGVCGGSAMAYETYPTANISVSIENDFDTSAVTPNFEKNMIHLDADTEPLFLTCLTQDHFCTSVSELPSGAVWYVDMELYSIASACKLFGNSLYAIKSISDIIGAENQSTQYDVNFSTACKGASKALEECLMARVMLE